MIELTDLTKQYGSTLAVDHLNLSVAKGEIFGFIGPNGAGKTTTIRMMAGVLGPTEGSVRI
jgi:ABC-type multidrug transport system ATPase subunit